MINPRSKKISKNNKPKIDSSILSSDSETDVPITQNQ